MAISEIVDLLKVVSNVGEFHPRLAKWPFIVFIATFFWKTFSCIPPPHAIRSRQKKFSNKVSDFSEIGQPLKTCMTLCGVLPSQVLPTADCSKFVPMLAVTSCNGPGLTQRMLEVKDQMRLSTFVLRIWSTSHHQGHQMVK
jgi:hypothetical protein